MKRWAARTHACTYQSSSNKVAVAVVLLVLFRATPVVGAPRAICRRAWGDAGGNFSPGVRHIPSHPPNPWPPQRHPRAEHAFLLAWPGRRRASQLPRSPQGRMSVRGNPAAAAAAGEEPEETAEELLARVGGMVPAALIAATAAAGFPGRWKAIAAKLATLPASLSDLSSHPCFARNALCRELLQPVAARHARGRGRARRAPPGAGKLRTQSAIDALAGRLDVNLRDCSLLVRTGVLSDASPAVPTALTTTTTADVRELLARLQIGHGDAKGRAVDGILDAMDRDEKSVVSAVGRANVAALVQLLTAPAPGVREKAAAVVCRLAESGSCEGMLVSEGALPPLIRLAESGLVVHKKAVQGRSRSGGHCTP